ncbi:MAG TPA: SpvB/TcaC N-terminal domain-containing protein, partial [Pyrinomonadaceae bacterium]|nr:SpvB/TcaC N-terminal domain-containing protein [Pyrinomonadaceae bacterium]
MRTEADNGAQPTNGQAGRASLPSVALPKGGGAVRGMGEKFGANPATGTGSLTVPLATSEGRAGFTPRLSLSYDSGSGNGPFGFGWSLGLPAVTRKTDKGLPRYLDEEESDTFIISGAEDLVPVLDAAGERVELQRTLHKVAYKIRPYRPRVEGLFSRVERWTRADDGTSHWRAITRDNVTTFFGFDENGRVYDPDDPRRVFSYLISFTYDDKGNANHYVYAREDSRGVDVAAAHEAQRTEGGREVGRYLKRVRYGNVAPYFPDWSEDGDPTPWPSDWHFQVVFDYGDHDADAPGVEPDRDWPARPDAFSSYRAGFEARTYRRCGRVLLFHRFEGRPGFDAPALVRSTDLRYSDEDDAADPRNPVYTFLASATQTGYGRSNGATLRRSAPPLEFSYTRPELQTEVLTLDEAESRSNLPEGLDGARFRWVDLDSEGLPGILSEQDGGWGYKRNLSPLNGLTLPGGARVVRARFGPQERVAQLPAPASLAAGQQLLDLDGAGRLDLASFRAHAPGYFARTTDAGWLPFKTFPSLPNIDWSDANLKFVDLTGDGRADVLVTEEEVFTFYPSLGAEGFGAAERVRLPWDEAKGPRVVFADGTQTVSLADMSGDGLSDIVRVRNGEVCYWPSLGYGRFGARVTMDSAPRFTDDERFDARRVRLADVDGSGTTDLLYVGADGVRLSFNRSGNSWAEPHLLA